MLKKDGKKFGSLFSGIGGFELGLEPLRFKCAWQFEKDRFCRKLLTSKFPLSKLYGDVRTAGDCNLETVGLVCGGDPCQCRSRATMGKKSATQDMSGYFLNVIYICMPGWVIRENVPASDVKEFVTAMDVLGYRSAVIELNGADFTSQRRTRQFVIGCNKQDTFCRFKTILERSCASRDDQTNSKEKREEASCLTTRPDTRYCSEDNYVYEEGRGIRVLDITECERLQGFPVGWTEGFTKTTRYRMLGNAVIPAMVRWIGERILEAEL